MKESIDYRNCSPESWLSKGSCCCSEGILFICKRCRCRWPANRTNPSSGLLAARLSTSNIEQRKTSWWAKGSVINPALSPVMVKPRKELDINMQEPPSQRNIEYIVKFASTSRFSAKPFNLFQWLIKIAGGLRPCIEDSLSPKVGDIFEGGVLYFWERK